VPTVDSGRQLRACYLMAHLDASPDFVSLANAKNSQILYLNRAGRAMMGLKEGVDITQLKITDLHPEWANKMFEKIILPTAIREDIWQGESAILHRQGHEIPVSMVLTAHKSPAGEVEMLSASSHDITGRKQAEAELRIAATAFEAHEGMMITDANSVILRVNQAFIEITGYTAEEAVGQTPRLLRSGHHDAAFYASMWERLTNDGAWEGEVWNRRKNGEIYPEYLTITSVKDPSGSVMNYVNTFNDITMSRTAVDQQIYDLAFLDPLTCLPNRRLLLHQLQWALASSTRTGLAGSLLFIDLDNFKSLNDTLGYSYGDLLLQQVARRLELCVRKGDTVARICGDEFVVMLENLSEHELDAATQTKAVGEKILATLNQSYQLAGHEYRSTVSIGITLFTDHNQSQEDLLKQVDIAMYHAKALGNNALCFFDPLDARVYCCNVEIPC
jgi:diguanylate cyclase (GGDEF)-like protein/PAS domain S-box-containing protein